MSLITLNTTVDLIQEQISASGRAVPFFISPTKIVKTALAVITLNATLFSKAQAEAFNLGKVIYCAIVCSFESVSPPNYGYCFTRCMSAG